MSELRLPELWTKETVEAWLEEAAQTERAFPPVKPSERSGFWPDIRRDYHEAYNWNEEEEVRCMPSAEQIDRYDFVAKWCRLLSPEIASLIWAKAMHLPRKLILDRHGLGKTRYYEKLEKAHSHIASELTCKVDLDQLGRNIVARKTNPLSL